MTPKEDVPANQDSTQKTINVKLSVALLTIGKPALVVFLPSPTTLRLRAARSVIAFSTLGQAVLDANLDGF
jgi:hypothetical protein